MKFQFVNLHSQHYSACFYILLCWGEVAKDEKYLATVEKVGSDFILFVVESFGAWTPFVFKTLSTILFVLPLAMGFLIILQGKICFHNIMDEQRQNDLRHWALQGINNSYIPSFPKLYSLHASYSI